MKRKGFLFDLDGTLVDSLPAVERAWMNRARQNGVAIDEVLDFIHGKQAMASLRHFMPGASEESVRQAFHALEDMESEDIQGVVAMPVALALIATLEELDIPWGIVTSGSIPIASARRCAAEIPEPEAFVTAERVQNGKPAPDAYLLGDALLELEPEECVVLEDAAACVLSGLAAGCHVITVNAPPESPRLDEVTMQLSSLEDLIVHKNPDGSVDIFRKH
ncbi:sugar phosphatase [Erwinia tracheiphila]|uniref:Phosphatase n=1 Tax=Erwinia tracheiphila TaxID=65700 RepID=A0A0M2KD57_9GAMM|nr:sugar phosphatase [Erwinia tracheiphila]AXF76497.1 sugar phosphatase [Erwinia tracheiphila]EOS96202.1 phosphatase [Erwinia tracheiphila PSU-1]KKF35237.1 phosphatase [Erwinia tracheiphila]UIA84836.1 sugar phosphatase [Erwinia tracheiphila]UIA86897.1 sugar phosphatase [Erwinia tracheiphila]